MTNLQKAAADRVALKTADAYSRVFFSDVEWRKAARQLMARYGSETAVEGVLRSKWTRWSRDEEGRRGSRGTAKGLMAFIDDRRNRCTNAQVAEFAAGIAGVK